MNKNNYNNKKGEYDNIKFFKKKNTVWQRPVIVPVPDGTAGVAENVISLNGTWKFTMEAPHEFWSDSVNPDTWDDVNVPGECWMQGFKILKDVEYPYKKLVDIPADFNNKTIILKFEGVYSYTRVWVNGKFVRDHTGGFTAWDCDITKYVTPGEQAWITVGVTDKSDDLSYGSGYAHHEIGGILRNVKLIALPKDYITRLHAITDFDEQYENAVLHITAAVNFNEAKNVVVNLSLKDPQGRDVPIDPSSINLSKSKNEDVVSFPISSPLKWDAENPNLYTLNASLLVEDNILETLSKKIGFREVVMEGHKVYVNGNEIKLKGVNVHDIHPLYGRATTDELDDQHVKVFKEANINFIRTSHYPRTDAFLDACDKYGVYILEETAVCWNWKNQNRPVEGYMNQFSEMIEKDLSHPSIIIWSLGNECLWDVGFEKELEYVKQEDPTRLNIASITFFPLPGYSLTDIYSYHYPSLKEFPLSVTSQPTIYDEVAHVSCYNKGDLKSDPGIRNFWGESIKIYWERMFNTEGCLGGAIWASTDEVFETPVDNLTTGFGQWGIIDGWRRPKPEYWLVKKAFSPIRIEDAPIKNPGSGNKLNIPAKNWFDSTNFNKVEFRWSIGPDSGSITDLDVAPHSEGVLVLPARNWKCGDVVNIKCYKENHCIDEFLLPICKAAEISDEYKVTSGTVPEKFPEAIGQVPIITENEESITVCGDDFTVIFSKETGQITKGTYNGSTVINGGPRLNLGRSFYLSIFSLSDICFSVTGNEAIINIEGRYGIIEIVYTIKIDGTGLITTQYSVKNLPAHVTEIGIVFDISTSIDRLSWKRKGLWSVYPSDHIGRNVGIAYRGNDRNYNYRNKPLWSWSQDMKDFYLFGSNDSGNRGTNDFRSQKEYIVYAAALLNGSDTMLRTESDGTVAVRMEEFHGKKAVVINNRDPLVKYGGSPWGSTSVDEYYNGMERWSNEKNAYIEYTFTGSAVEVIGCKSIESGKLDVYIDGVLDRAGLDTYNPGKSYGQLLYSKTDLSDDEHTIKIVVTGEKNESSADCYIIFDCFRISDKKVTDNLSMIINNEWSYNWGSFGAVALGNYTKSICVPSDYTNTIKVRLTDKDA